MSHGNSTPVSSNQKFASRRLDPLLERYKREFKRPIPIHTEDAFNTAMEQLRESGKSSCILDAGCGTGDSTFELAKSHEESFIVGIDKSAHRLNRERERKPETESLTILRADLFSFFQIAEREEFSFEKIYFLYPNPWPKTSQKKRTQSFFQAGKRSRIW